MNTPSVLNLDALQTYLHSLGDNGEAQLAAYKVQSLVNTIYRLQEERDTARAILQVAQAEAWDEGREAARELVFDYDVDQAMSALDNPFDERPPPHSQPWVRTVIALSKRWITASEALRAAVPVLVEELQDYINNNKEDSAPLWREGMSLPPLDKHVARMVDRRLTILAACRLALGQKPVPEVPHA